MRWMLLQKCTLQPVTLVYSMVLARLLSKEEMGLMGLTAIFFTAAGTLAAGGFGSALIRKQNYTSAEADTMFWFNLGMGLLIALLFFCTAPKAVKRGQEYSVTITPRSTAKAALNRLVLTTDAPDPRYHRPIIYLQVQK